MIIPRHKICDICKKELSGNIAYITLHERSERVGRCGDIHLCRACYLHFQSEVKKALDNKE